MDLFGLYRHFIGFIHIGIIHNYTPNFINSLSLRINFKFNDLTSTNFYRPATVLLGYGYFIGIIHLTLLTLSLRTLTRI